MNISGPPDNRQLRTAVTLTGGTNGVVRFVGAGKDGHDVLRGSPPPFSPAISPISR